MKKIYYILLCSLFFMSCTSQYYVEGNSTVQSMDGKKLYLKVYKNDDLVDIDSCEVVHGKFRFEGVFDSVMMVNLFMDDQSIMPFVLDAEELKIHIDNVNQYVTGSEMNDSLYSFIRQKSRLDNLMSELPHLESQMIMDGVEEHLREIRLQDEANRIAAEHDRLITSFITSNFDNVLGPGVFMIFTSGFPYPVLTPQIEEILLKATPYFMNDEYVKKYVEAAKENMQNMGMGYGDIEVNPTENSDMTLAKDSVELTR